MHGPWCMSLGVPSKFLVLQACQHILCSPVTVSTTAATTAKYRSGAGEFTILPSLVMVTILWLRQTGRTHGGMGRAVACAVGSLWRSKAAVVSALGFHMNRSLPKN